MKNYSQTRLLVCSPYRAIGKANVQKTLFFVTALYPATAGK
ncbi:hypothetical protein [Rodentibacter sp. Ppn85]|nr:hypothetical protein [Rodentibacter sp. Ppn85]